ADSDRLNDWRTGSSGQRSRTLLCGGEHQVVIADGHAVAVLKLCAVVNLAAVDERAIAAAQINGGDNVALAANDGVAARDHLVVAQDDIACGCAPDGDLRRGHLELMCRAVGGLPGKTR